MKRLLLAMTAVIPAAALAVAPVNGATPTLTPVTINAAGGDQYDPHVSGDWAAYTADTTIRYYNFGTAADAAIPPGSSARDLLSDISGSKVVFSRVITGVRTAVMVFDAATAAAPTEINPTAASLRIGSAIGANTVAYIDFGLHAAGEVVVHDLSTSSTLRLTTDTAFDQNPSVSPDGNLVTWEHCATSLSNCDIWQAAKSGAVWSVSVTSDSTANEANPDTNGALVVYDSLRSGNADLFWRPAGGGAEAQLQLSGFEMNPSIAGDFIAFESRATLFDASDLFVYDLANNRLYQITNTPLITEQLNDITVLTDGRVRVVWSSDEDGFDQRNVKGATFALGGSTSCLNRTVVLDASRLYRPSVWNDASATMSPAMSFALPATIPVTAGNSGNHYTTLSFSLNGTPVVCRYRGGSNKAHPTGGQLNAANKYVFERCDDASLAAGDIVTADHVTLHVHNGDSWEVTTAIRATLAEECDTGSASSSLSGAPDAKQGPMGCSSAGGAPTVLMLLALGAWLLVSRRTAMVTVRARH